MRGCCRLYAEAPGNPVSLLWMAILCSNGGVQRLVFTDSAKLSVFSSIGVKANFLFKKADVAFALA